MKDSYLSQTQKLSQIPHFDRKKSILHTAEMLQKYSENIHFFDIKDDHFSSL